MLKLDSDIFNISVYQEIPLTGKGKPQNWKRYLKYICPPKFSYLDYIKNPYNSVKKISNPVETMGIS